MSELDLVDRWIESLQILAGDADNPTAEQRAAMAVTRRRMLDTYAHGLAEQQRAWAIEQYPAALMHEQLLGATWAADHVDPRYVRPEVGAGPVRPGEETTP